MKDYTVVLLRPDYIANSAVGEGHGLDIYVAAVKADSLKAAEKLAQKQVFKADKKDELEPRSPDDYALCVMFEGHPKVALFGWQLR